MKAYLLIIIILQIATLKAVLSKNEGSGGSDHSQGSMATPAISKLRTCGISPLHSNRLVKDISGGNSKPRQPMEEVGNIEVCTTNGFYNGLMERFAWSN